MNSKEIEILDKAAELFLTLGIKSLTMTDLASRMGISKKTLYTVVTDKNDLVNKVMERQIAENNCEINEACINANNAIEELIEFSKIANDKIKVVHPSIFFDLQKFHPEAWATLDRFENCTMKELTKNNLERGIKEGLYREDLNADIIASVYVSVMHEMFNRPVPNRNSVGIQEFYFQVFTYHIRGIASEKGIQLINQHLN
jgi:AcrR family transcriptional regulator